jgi:acyl carrier protein
MNTATTTDTTALLVTIYRETLGMDGLDEWSDFFEAGGDSLTAFQITARIQEARGAEIPVSLVFAYPSPGDLAEVIDADYGQE